VICFRSLSYLHMYSSMVRGEAKLIVCLGGGRGDSRGGRGGGRGAPRGGRGAPRGGGGAKGGAKTIIVSFLVRSVIPN
jgi:hypothetical protein